MGRFQSFRACVSLVEKSQQANSGMTRLATNWTRVWALSDGVLTEEEDLQVLQQVPRTTASMNPPSVQPKSSGAPSSFMEPGTRGSKETWAVA